MTPMLESADRNFKIKVLKGSMEKMGKMSEKIQNSAEYLKLYKRIK